MQFISISEVSNIYHYDYLSVNQVHNVSHEKFAEFSKDISYLEHDLGQETRDTYWVPLLKTLRKFRYYLCSAPLSFDYRGLEKNGETLSWLKKQISLCTKIYPVQANKAEKILSNLEQLYGLHENPLLDSIDKIIGKLEKNTAILIREPSLISYVNTTIRDRSSLPHVEVISCAQLRGPVIFQSLVMVGAPQWFSQDEYVFSAPRVSNIHIVKYNWLENHWKPNIEIFGVTHNPNREESLRQLNIVINEEGKTIPDLISSTELVPFIDWNNIKMGLEVKQGMNRFTGTEETEYVDAKLFLLEGGAAVALDCNPSAKATVVDPEQIDRSPLKRILVQDIVPGRFILVRTQGSREYIAEAADMIMGSESLTARKEQRYWKSLLKHAVQNNSISNVISELKTLGANLANEINVRNWMSNRTIKPKNRNDFYAIMRLIGLENEIDHYWVTMGMIDIAHLRAGQRIAKLLLSEVRKSDISQLSNTGRMDFTIPGVKAGTLSAIRVLGIHDELVSVPVHRLDRLFEEGELDG